MSRKEVPRVGLVKAALAGRRVDGALTLESPLAPASSIACPPMSANRRMTKPREADATTQQHMAGTNSTEGSTDLTRPAAS